MKAKAKVPFCGLVTMAAGEVKDITDKALVSDLIQAGYVVPVEEEGKTAQKKKAVKSDGNK